jgi:aldehyde dehydrogenase (NAD+)
LACAYLIEAAGFPPGVFQILAGSGTVGAALASHPDIDKISFTGSTATGRKIQDAATKSNMKRVTLELGGKSPALVFEDADIPAALFWCTMGITVNTGQVCAATSMLFVQESIAEKFLEQLRGRFEGIAKGLGADPQDQSTTYGPLVDKIQFDNVHKFIQNAQESSGASLLTGGEKYKGNGFYVSPTVFVNPDTNSDIYRKEVFGPVLCVKTFKTEEEAVELANDTTYGLAGAVFTKDIARALRVSTAVRGGTLCVNCALMVGPQAPMGGFGESGYGRELGEYALRHYTEPKTIWVKYVEPCSLDCSN